jgi:very-short-patch-repair endonuclease
MREGQSIARARRLRREMTRAEGLLWRVLRGHRLAGLNVRRQAPRSSYIGAFCAN